MPTLREMQAWTIRADRFGPPKMAFARENIPIPQIGDNEVLVAIKTAGVNYNGIWAASGQPVDLIALRRRQGESEDFHIAGSDGAGVVYRVGPAVTGLREGDEVVLFGGWWDPDCPDIKSGADPVLSRTFKAWGYETNYGSFGTFARVRAHQCLPKPPRLSWEEAGCYMVSGATAYRMLHGFSGNTVGPGDVVLIWGGSGGLGSMAIQIAKEAGARPIAVVSSSERADYCLRLGAVGTIDRTRFDHWGRLPGQTSGPDYRRWLEGVKEFGRAIWEAVGEPVSPKIVFEHTGEDTLPTSLFVCARGGMVVTCGATTGYSGSLDLRYLWMHQKRLQGAHVSNLEHARKLNSLVSSGGVSPCLSRVFTSEQLPLAHQIMVDNKHPSGNMAIRIADDHCDERRPLDLQHPEAYQ